MPRRPRSRSARQGPATLGIHGGGHRPGAGEPVVPSLIQSATFYGDGRGDLLYTRYGNNPLQVQVGQKLAELEGAEAGLVVGSGMGAIAMTLLALTQSGDHIVASSHLYGATRTLLEDELPRRGVTTTLVDAAEGRHWRRAARKRTRVLYLELPTNPTLRLFDPEPVAHLARELGVVFVMDATFATPVNFSPLDHGVDVVLHSATKYLGGHSDLIAGAVCGPAEVVEEVTRCMRLYGPAADPHMVWLLDRGLRTLDVRVRKHNENAAAVAAFLAERDEVARVWYPGREDHPDHALARKLLSGYGGMVSFVLKGGGKAADRFCQRLQLLAVAPSLGGVETLVSQPRYTSHASLPAKARKQVGIPDGFIRVSVGIENVEDLLSDLEQALEGL